MNAFEKKIAHIKSVFFSFSNKKVLNLFWTSANSEIILLAAKKETRKIKGDICGKCLGLQIGDKQNLGDKILGKGKLNCDGQKLSELTGISEIQTYKRTEKVNYICRLKNL